MAPACPEHIANIRQIMAAAGIDETAPPEASYYCEPLEGDDLERAVAVVRIGIPQRLMPSPEVLTTAVRRLRTMGYVCECALRGGTLSCAVTTASYILAALDELADLGSEEAARAIHFWHEKFAQCGIAQRAVIEAATWRGKVL
jgi:hypothetical protein